MNFWWEKEKGMAYESIFSIVRYLGENQAYVQEGHSRNMRLYGNLSPNAGKSGYSQQAVGSGQERISYNVIQSCVDTVTQKIAKNRPRPSFLTEGGDYSLQKKAKLLNKFVDGQFYASGVYEYAKGPSAFRDACVFGTGILKIYRTKDQIKCERVFPGDVIVDESEGVYGTPRSMFQSAYVSKHQLEKMYPKSAGYIRTCKVATPLSGSSHKQMGDMVWVVEAWHLPGAKDAGDGRHVISIENCDLFDEEYEKDYFPFVKIDWNKRLLGWWGQGLSEQLTGIQIEINKILRHIQVCFNLAVPKYFIEMGSKINKAHVNNEIGGFVYYSGMKPEYIAPTPVNPEFFTHLQTLFAKAFEVSGISSLSATSQKPAGLNSGKALREYNDIESERFILSSMAWEQMHLEIAEQMIALAKEISEEDPSYAVMTKDGDKLERIKWRDVNLEADQYQMQLYPTNYLSKTPAGRLQDVVELSQAGFIDKPNALKLLDFPDLKSYTKFQNAAIDDLSKQIEEIMEHGKYSRPEPFQPLALGIQMFQSAYLYSRANDVPEKNMDLLRLWIEEAQAMIQQAQQAQQQQMMAQQMAMQPQAQPQQAMPAKGEVAPRNDLLPATGV